MQRRASSGTRLTQADAEPRVSRLHRPDEMSLEEWQRRLRKQFATEQPFRIENIGEHPIFSDYRVTNNQFCLHRRELLVSDAVDEFADADA